MQVYWRFNSTSEPPAFRIGPYADPRAGSRRGATLNRTRHPFMSLCSQKITLSYQRNGRDWAERVHGLRPDR